MAVGKVQLLPPMRFRFTDADDVAAYGDGWYVWDEKALARLPGRDLIALEVAVGMPIRTVIELLHDDATAGYLAAMWIALHRAGATTPWNDFNPLVLTTDWEEVPEESRPDPLGSGSAPPTPGSTSSTGPGTESVTSSPA